MDALKHDNYKYSCNRSYVTDYSSNSEWQIVTLAIILLQFLHSLRSKLQLKDMYCHCYYYFDAARATDLVFCNH